MKVVEYQELDFYRWLFKRYGEDVTAGDTTPQVRRDRSRALILRQPPAEREQVGQAFQRTFGEPLQPSVEHHENNDGV